MKVRLKRGWTQAFPRLTLGNVYRVVEISYDRYRLVSDAGEPVLFARRAFEVVDATRPPDWVDESDEDGVCQSGPAAFREPRNFFERWFDRDPDVRWAFTRYMDALCLAGRDEMRPPNERLRLDALAADAAVRTIYVELDDDRCEVRRVEVFADGSLGCADGNGSLGTAGTLLGDAPVPTLTELARGGAHAAVEITREELEAIFDRAVEASF